MNHTVRQVLLAQAICAAVLLIGVAGASLMLGADDNPLPRIVAAAYGAGLGITATIVTARSVVKSAQAAAAQPHFGLLPVFSGLLVKLALVAGGAYVGLAVFNLGALFMVAGYLAMQIGYVWVGLKSKTA